MPPVPQLNTETVHYKVTVFVGCATAQAFSCWCLKTQRRHPGVLYNIRYKIQKGTSAQQTIFITI